MSGDELIPLDWIGSSREDMAGFPRRIRQIAGYGLYVAQMGRKPANAEPFDRRFGAKVLKISIDYRGSTFRIVYMTVLRGSVCVLHAFKKKASKGRATPKHHIDLVEERLKWATKMHEAGDLPSQRARA